MTSQLAEQLADPAKTRPRGPNKTKSGVSATAFRVGCRLAALFAAGWLVAACSSQISRHGYVFTPTELRQIQPGATKEQVVAALGTPTTTSTVGGGTYYYISSKQETKAFFAPKVIDRRVVAIYFDPLGSVERVANYGLKDGRVFDFISRKTPAYTEERSLISQFFRGVGKRRPSIGGS